MESRHKKQVSLRSDLKIAISRRLQNDGIFLDRHDSLLQTRINFCDEMLQNSNNIEIRCHHKDTIFYSNKLFDIFTLTSSIIIFHLSQFAKRALSPLLSTYLRIVTVAMPERVERTAYVPW